MHSRVSVLKLPYVGIKNDLNQITRRDEHLLLQGNWVRYRLMSWKGMLNMIAWLLQCYALHFSGLVPLQINFMIIRTQHDWINSAKAENIVDKA